MDTPPTSWPAHGPRERSAVLGSITIPGRPRAVAGARAFVARTVPAAGVSAAADSGAADSGAADSGAADSGAADSGAADSGAVDSEAATLLTSELVTNAIQHTASGAPGGAVTIAVSAVARGVLIEVTDDGSAGVPTVRRASRAADGHGLYLVSQLAAQWGYRRDQAGTTVWFYLSAAPDSAVTAASTPAQIAATSSSPDT